MIGKNIIDVLKNREVGSTVGVVAGQPAAAQCRGFHSAFTARNNSLCDQKNVVPVLSVICMSNCMFANVPNAHRKKSCNGATFEKKFHKAESSFYKIKPLVAKNTNMTEQILITKAPMYKLIE